jgi:membrane-associated phospholipid phosphatase
LAAIGVAHQFDGNVRKHFTANSPGSLSTNTHDLQDALPAAAMFVGTWGYANLISDQWGRREAGTMFEAAALSVGTAYVLKFAAGRQRPDQTTDPNQWEAGGSSFPSVHTTAAFAIGTVLAESGNDEYRWLRRVLGYGAAGFTVYERLKHNAHWLSDTVAGAALGTATARFAMNRSDGAKQGANITVSPLYHGLMFNFVAHLP